MLDAGATPDRTQPDADERLTPSPSADEPLQDKPAPSCQTALENPPREEPPDTSVLADEPPIERPPDPALPSVSVTDLSLEERVCRLEDIIASLNLGPLPEQRPAESPPDVSSSAVDAADRGPLPNPAAAAVPAPSRRLVSLGGQGWLLFEIYAELRAILRLFFDPRYSLTWQTRLLAPLLLLGILLLKFMIGAIPLVGGITESILYPILLYMLFKVLSREATRYRMTSPDLPPALRL